MGAEKSEWKSQNDALRGMGVGLGEVRFQVEKLVSDCDQSKSNFELEVGTLQTELAQVRAESFTQTSQNNALRAELHELRSQTEKLASAQGKSEAVIDTLRVEFAQVLAEARKDAAKE